MSKLSVLTEEEFVPLSPLEPIEDVLLAQEWEIDHINALELSARVPGAWCPLTFFFSWSPETDMLHVSCAYEMDMKTANIPSLYQLMSLANEKASIGHFVFWQKRGVPILRQTIPLPDMGQFSADRFADILEFMLGEIDAFYPAFRYVISHDMAPDQALDATLLDTVGEA